MHGEEGHLGAASRPAIAGLDVHPGEGIERHVAGFAREFEAFVGDLFDRQLAGRQCREATCRAVRPPRGSIRISTSGDGATGT